MIPKFQFGSISQITYLRPSIVLQLINNTAALNIEPIKNDCFIVNFKKEIDSF